MGKEHPIGHSEKTYIASPPEGGSYSRQVDGRIIPIIDKVYQESTIYDVLGGEKQRTPDPGVHLPAGQSVFVAKMQEKPKAVRGMVILMS